jgi:hypothetical protein
MAEVAPAATPTSAASLIPLAVVSDSPDPAPAPSGKAATSPGPVASYPPRDECAVRPGYAAFRGKLAAAARKRDPAALTAVADPDIRLDFGGGAGREELRTRLAARPELWRAIQQVLQLGCASDGDLATMPWIFARLPESADPYRAMLVKGEKVPLRKRPAAGAPQRGELAWALVRPVGAFDPKAGFTEVETVDGALRGFVETTSLRGLLDYRLVAEPQEGGWAITAFIAGD